MNKAPILPPVDLASPLLPQLKAAAKSLMSRHNHRPGQARLRQLEALRELRRLISRPTLGLRAFRRASRQVQRMAIWLDVIRQLESENYQAAHRGYLVLGPHADIEPLASEDGRPWDLREVLRFPHRRPFCCVCALGGAFCSLVRLDDKAELCLPPVPSAASVSLELGEAFRSGLPRLLQIFGPMQLLLIEAAYEEGIVEHQTYPTRYQLTGRTPKEEARLMDAKGWCRRLREGHTWLGPTSKLKLLAFNILLNGGKFDPACQPSLSGG